MARTRGDGKQGTGRTRRKQRGTLKLVRVEPTADSAIALVFEGEGEEWVWWLENTSATEFLALLLRGRIQHGRRVMLPEVELTLEPPAAKGRDPTLCLAMGPLELCAAMDRAGAKALKADIEQALKRPS